MNLQKHLKSIQQLKINTDSRGFKMSDFISDNVNNFLQEIQPMCDGILGEIQAEAIQNNVPIIPPEVAKFIEVILQIKKPKYILEIGTAVAFSSALMSQYLDEGGNITTIERFDVMRQQAYTNIKKLNLENKINLIEGDAAQILPTLKTKYDVVFVDAAKAQYNAFLPECIRLLNVGGILIADDVLQNGIVAESRYDIPRRHRTIHKRMRNFLWNISNNKILKSAIIPIGNGVAVCCKIAEN